MKRKVLVVDDESSIRDALSKVLNSEDYEVVSAANGQQAMEKFGQERIDLLLLDLGLPVKDGWEMLEWLAHVNPLLPVVIITGRYEQRELAEAAGVDALMEKPLNVPQLLQTIRELMDEPINLRGQRRNRTSRFRYVPCDNELFIQGLGERFLAPYPCPG